MKSSEADNPELHQTITQPIPVAKTLSDRFTVTQLRGSLLFIVGFLLSPLCWWNDLVFNLPVAYGVGYLCGLVSASWFLPGLIAGYWLSNILGFILMQFGAIDTFQKEPKSRNPLKELLMGVVSSTIYTLVILALVQLHIIDPASLLPTELFNLGFTSSLTGLSGFMNAS